MWSNERADVIFVFGMGLDAVFGFAVGLVVVCNFLAQHGGAILGVVVALRVPLLCKHEMSLWIASTSPQFIIVSGVSPRRYSEFSTSILQISVHFYLSGQHQSMSEIECQRLNVRDSMSETQCQRLNVRDLMSEMDVLSWSHVFAIPPTWVYNSIMVYKGIPDLSSWVFDSWTAARPSVNADWLLAASRSWVVFLSTGALISLVQFAAWVGNLQGTCRGAIKMVFRQIWGLQRG